jgi:hypothetical protein
MVLRAGTSYVTLNTVANLITLSVYSRINSGVKNKNLSWYVKWTVRVNCFFMERKRTQLVKSAEKELFADLWAIFRNIIDHSMDSHDQRQSVKDLLVSYEESMLLSMKAASASVCAGQEQATSTSLCVLNPIPVQTKGRPRTGGKRLKSSLEKENCGRKKKQQAPPMNASFLVANNILYFHVAHDVVCTMYHN